MAAPGRLGARLALAGRMQPVHAGAARAHRATLPTQALVDSPDSIRHVESFKRLTLTNQKIDIPRLAKKAVIKAKFAEAGAWGLATVVRPPPSPARAGPARCAPDVPPCVHQCRSVRPRRRSSCTQAASPGRTATSCGGVPLVGGGVQHSSAATRHGTVLPAGQPPLGTQRAGGCWWRSSQCPPRLHSEHRERSLTPAGAQLVQQQGSSWQLLFRGPPAVAMRAYWQDRHAAGDVPRQLCAVPRARQLGRPLSYQQQHTSSS